ncbi:MAG: methenyltetrahydrofolate cyclohydrolase [Chloroflexota bacterium]|jgi:formiminotetrahydrofolate cyclodeaminase|nr:methenyltetrahydrofolate cyclohydrolase [Chloroflexota bacterium]
MAPDPGSYADFTLSGFTEALASAEPVPGGGSASAVAASIAASLVVMVARLSLDRPKYAAFTATHERAIAAGEAARQRFLELADADAREYSAFTAAMKLPRETDEQRATRDSALDVAARAAAGIPLEVVRHCRELLEDVESLAGRSNLNASSDLDVAALLGQAAARGAGANVVINLGSIADTRESERMLAELEVHLHQIESVTAFVHGQVQSGTLREPEAA